MKVVEFLEHVTGALGRAGLHGDDDSPDAVLGEVETLVTMALGTERLGPFLLFSGPDYYPQGGAEDLVGAFDTMASAVAELAAEPMGTGRTGEMPAVWAHVLDVGSATIVKAWTRDDPWSTQTWSEDQ